MKKLFGLAILGSTLALVGCGGGESDSSGHQDHTSSTNNPNKPKDPVKPTKPDNKPTTCKSDGNTVFATAKGCTYSIANLNGGEPQTYVCSGGRVSSGGMSAKTINMNGVTIKCAN